MAPNIFEQSIIYHREPKPGKLAIIPTKPLEGQSDLALAYSPGVAGPCLAIAEDQSQVAYLTARANLIGVVTNGTAVLGLGNIGPYAAKPVMEGKAVLFKKFAGIDTFDIELNENDPEKLVEIIAALEPTFGGINLEDIKAPECFYVESKLAERLSIPVFHDDQHGTAIIVAAAILNGLKIVGKNLSDVKLVTSGAGAAALSCVGLLVSLGLKKENLILTDIAGVVYQGRTECMDEIKERYAVATAKRTLAEVMPGADIFLGLSVAGVVKPEMIAQMADKPLIFALANPEPEIHPDLIKQIRADAIIATGRSDFVNQVNNVLCFPYIFRGALDVGATKINQEMKIACVEALARVAQAEGSDIVSKAYGGEVQTFGPDYIIPKPFDPRLAVELPIVVAEAAMATGVATRPIQDMEAYRARLNDFVYRSGMVMRPVFARAKKQMSRIAFAEGEDLRVLRAVQVLVDEKLCKPILIGRPEVVARRAARLGLRITQGKDFDLIDPGNDNRYTQYWQAYHKIMERRGISPDIAKMHVRTNTTVIAALTVHLGDADSLIAGTFGRYHIHLRDVVNILGINPKYGRAAALSLMVHDKGAFFITDPYVNFNPTAEDICQITQMAVEQVHLFGIKPKIALLSHSNFGSLQDESALKMVKALELLRDQLPKDIEIDGEMHADAALSAEIRRQIFPNSTLTGEANLLVMPSIEAANIAFNLIKVLDDAQPVGPMLMGTNKPGHIVTPSITVRGIVNIAAFAAVESQQRKRDDKGVRSSKE